MDPYPNITLVPSTQYKMATRVGWDYDRLELTFRKTPSGVTADSVLEKLLEGRHYGYWFASGEVSMAGVPISLQEAMRVVADDVDYALTELAKPEY